MKVHYFNPGYEASVAYGLRHFTPSRQVQAFRNDLAALPIYYKDPKDKVLIPDVLPTHIMHPCFLTDLPESCELSPWGWAPELLGRFGEKAMRYTVEESAHFASRRLSLLLWRHIVSGRGQAFFDTFEPPRMVSTLTPDDLVSREGKGWVLKDEFASSGRGVRFVRPIDNLLQKIAVSGKIKDAKELFIEPYYPGVEDRGYEFFRDARGNIRYLGVSSFITDHGHYKGNRVTSADSLELQMNHIATTPSHQEYIAILTEALIALPLGYYEGFLGVDTLVFDAPDGEKMIVPVIEINCRTTMGHLALALADRWIPKGFDGYFSIYYLPSEPLPDSLVTEIPLYALPAFPNKEGSYLLTPVTSNSRFAALLSLARSGS